MFFYHCKQDLTLTKYFIDVYFKFISYEIRDVSDNIDDDEEENNCINNSGK